MRTRSSATIALVSVVLIAVPVGVLYGSMYLKERQRVNDADPAFRPILHLRCRIVSQPVAFHRYCRYVIEFPQDCSLCDANIMELNSLNRLPNANTLDITIHTRTVTDASLPHLMALRTFDLLDVTDTCISDAGIERLRNAFPDAIVPTRSSE